MSSIALLSGTCARSQESVSRYLCGQIASIRLSLPGSVNLVFKAWFTCLSRKPLLVLRDFTKEVCCLLWTFSVVVFCVTSPLCTWCKAVWIYVSSACNGRLLTRNMFGFISHWKLWRFLCSLFLSTHPNHDQTRMQCYAPHRCIVKQIKPVDCIRPRGGWLWKAVLSLQLHACRGSIDLHLFERQAFPRSTLQMGIVISRRSICRMLAVHEACSCAYKCCMC